MLDNGSSVISYHALSLDYGLHRGVGGVGGGRGGEAGG